MHAACRPCPCSYARMKPHEKLKARTRYALDQADATAGRAAEEEGGAAAGLAAGGWQGDEGDEDSDGAAGWWWGGRWWCAGPDMQATCSKGRVSLT